jgi:hypothetical protein
MYTEHPTPNSLASALLPKFPDAHVEAEQFVKLSTSDVEVIVWVSERLKILRIRAVLVRRDELQQLTESQCDNLTADLNGTFTFGRFNATSLVGLLYEHEIPYAPSIALDLVAQSIELIGRGAKASRDIYVERAFKRA